MKKILRKRNDDMATKNYKSLDLSKLTDKKNIIVSSEKALKDVPPINWSNDVLSGKKKVLVDCNK